MWRDIATATVGGAVFGAGINIGIGGGSKILGKTKAITESDIWKTVYLIKKQMKLMLNFYK